LLVSGFRLRALGDVSIPFLSLRPARHYPRFWIRRSSSERRRDLNPPDLGAAQRTVRVHPSLCLALVLGSSRFCRLEVSLGIEATGSHVPHKSLSLVSRRLHAGRRSASRQASSELYPRPTTGAWFRRRPNAFDTSSTVHSRSSYQRTPDGLSRLFRNAHHPGHCAEAAYGGLDPDPAIRVRGADPHLLCSKAASSWLRYLHPSLLFAPSWRTIISVPTPWEIRVSPRHPQADRRGKFRRGLQNL